MTLNNLLYDIRHTVKGNKITLDISDFEEIQARYVNAMIDAAINESEEHYKRTGIEHDARKVLADLRKQYVRKI